MIKILKKIVLIFFILIQFSVTAYGSSFYIDNYDIKIDVDRFKKLHITEKIDVVFQVSSHGIIRQIDLGKYYIDNIRVNDTNEVRYNKKFIEIKIGNPRYFVPKQVSYLISYDLQYTDNKAELYHNLIGTGWSTKIRKVNFEINLPIPVDKEQVGLSIGQYGHKGFDEGALYKIESGLIKGYTTRSLDPNEAITLRVNLDSRYFIPYKDNLPRTFLIISIILTLLSYLLWYYYGKDFKVIPVVNFRIPKGVDPFIAELVYSEKVTEKSIAAFLIDLAARGYVKIEPKGKSDFAIRKIKIPKESGIEKDFMESLFRGEELVLKEELASNLSFGTRCFKILTEKSAEKYQYFIQHDMATFLSWLLTLSCLVCFTGTYFSKQFLLYFLWYNLPNILEYVSFILLCVYVFMSKSYGYLVKIFLTVISAVGSICLSWTLIPERPVMSFLGFTCFVISLICSLCMSKRNKKGTKLYSDLLGLKHFIKVTKVNHIRILVHNNPTYFYDVLPYAYVLGVSDYWIKHFTRAINVDPGLRTITGYSDMGVALNNTNMFRNFTTSICRSSSQSLKYCKSSQKEGGFFGGIGSSGGGGGFAGGGGGGGGGRAW